MSVADLAAGVSVSAARRLLAQRFKKRGIETPELDARLLIGHALGLDHAGLAAAAGHQLSVAEVEAVAALAARRLKHEPVARILGRKEFWGLELLLGAATLVPRPETETVVEAALAAIDATGGRERPLRVADLCTGSGALLLALLSELPRAYGIGTDIAPGTLPVARDNARRLGLAARAGFLVCDLGTALTGGFDVVVCNPPYVASGDIAGLPPEVRDHDPICALNGGVDGLDFYLALAADAARLIAPAGCLVVELGAGQAAPVQSFVRQAGLAVDPPRHDLAGIARALTIRAAS